MLLPGAKCRRMARKLSVQYPGAIYRVMNRGDRREAIFTDAEDRHLYPATLGEACEKTDWQIHAWCLMSNHFHPVVETPRVVARNGSPIACVTCPGQPPPPP
jgi:REP element-mobilizing transposase RayT